MLFFTSIWSPLSLYDTINLNSLNLSLIILRGAILSYIEEIGEKPLEKVHPKYYGFPILY